MTAEPSTTRSSSTRLSASDATRPGGGPGAFAAASTACATAVESEAREAQPRLVVVSGPGRGRSHPLDAAETTLGRDAACAVVLVDAAVSRRHAVIRREGPAHVLIDRGSGNGTRVNGRKVARHRLRPGDEIALGKAILLFEVADEGRGAGARPTPRADGRARVRGWAAGILLAAAAGTGGLLLFRMRREAVAEAARRGERERALAQRHLAEAARLFGEGRAADGRQQLAMAAELGAGRLAAELGARAEAEAPLAQAVERARAAVVRGDFPAAREALDSVPAGALIAPAAAAARGELDRALEAAARAAGPAPEAVAPGAPASQPPRPAAASKEARSLDPKGGHAGPRPPRSHEGGEGAPASAAILAAYRAGDVAFALARAAADPRCRQLARDLEAFAAAVREGQAKAKAGHALEAIAALESAAALDRDIAEDAGAEEGTSGDVRGAPAAEVGRSLGKLHLDLGLALAKGPDDELPGAAAHLRAALAAGSDDGRAQAALLRVAARAREAYLRGYVAKDSDPDGARRAFRLVLGALPASDETAQKARRWLEKLDAKGGEG